MSSTTYQARSVPSGPPPGAQSLQRMPSSDSYFFQQPSNMQPYPSSEYRPQSLAYAMTINPSDVNMSRIPPAGDSQGSMTSVEPLLSEEEAQGTLESPFCSNALQRGISNQPSTSNPQTAADDTSATSSPTPLEEVEVAPTVLEKDSKPVTSPPIRLEQPPRPPNAWILYRSERLRAIAAGEPIAGLLAVLEAQSLVRALDVSEQRVPGTKESSSSPEPNRFQLFKDAEPPSPGSQKSVKEDPKSENGSKYRRALLQADISKVISMMWKREDKEVKSKYEAMAGAKKLEHQQKYPNYKYQPMRKEEKLKQQEQIKAEKELLKREAMAEKAHQRKLAKAARQLRAAQDKSIAYAIKSPGESKKSRQRRQLPQSSHVLTIPLFENPQSQDSSGTTPPAPAPTPLAEHQPPFFEQSFHSSIPVKQEPLEPSYYLEAPMEPRPRDMQMMPEYNGVPAQYQPQHQQLMYHLHPGGYGLPASQPGFFVQHDEVVPYTFEPIPFDQYYHGHRQAPPQNSERYADLSSKSQPAVAVMAPAEYHHVGVSEAELAEMWAMLEDDNGTTGPKQVVNQVQVRATTGNFVRNDINEEDMESYSNLPATVDEPSQEFVPQPRLSSIVGTQIAMNWVGEPGFNDSVEQVKSTQTQNVPPMSKEEEDNASLTPRAKGTGLSRFAAPMPISINATKAQDYYHRPRKDSILAAHTPLSPIDGVYTPNRPYASTPLQSLYQASDLRRGERRLSEATYMPYPQSFPNDFTEQPATYEYRFMTPRTATFREGGFAPLSMSAPSERWDGIAWQDSLAGPNQPDR